MCLRAEGIDGDDDEDCVGRVRRDKGLSDDDGGVGREQGYVTRPRGQIQQRRRRGIDDRPEEFTTTAEASKEEDEHEDYKNDNGCVGGG